MKTTYNIKTRDGITFSLEASNYREAEQRASSPVIAKHIALMIQQALNNITSIEVHKGPKHLIKTPFFEDEFFQ